QRFAGTTIEEEALKRYARDNRSVILRELLGMIVRWLDAHRPLGTRSHRCTRWAELVGGILLVAGLPEFLANQDALIAEVAEVAEDLQELALLAEHVVSRNKVGFYTENGVPANSNDIGRQAGDWAPVLGDAGLRQNELTSAKTDRAVAIFVGHFFGARLGKPVPVPVNEHTGTATLKAQPGPSR